MDFNATIDLIIRDLDEAREIIDDLKKYPGVPVLQVEFAKAKCKSAAEVISLLKQAGESQKPEVRSQKSEDRSPKTEEKSPKPDLLNLTPDAGGPSPVIQNSKIDQPVKKLSESAIIGDSFTHLSNRFNEHMGERKPDDDLSGLINTKHLTTLNEAIGINDKFFYIREIFGGNKDAYTQALTRLENAISINDARAVIMSYTGDNAENDAVKQLLDLVKRKLPSNE
jgi:hypothetical protein